MLKTTDAHHDALVCLVTATTGNNTLDSAVCSLYELLEGRVGAIVNGVGIFSLAKGVHKAPEMVVEGLVLGVKPKGAVPRLGVELLVFHESRARVVDHKLVLGGANLLQPGEVVLDALIKHLENVLGHCKLATGQRVQALEIIPLDVIHGVAVAHGRATVALLALLHEQAACAVALASHGDGSREAGDTAAYDDDVELLIPALLDICLVGVGNGRSCKRSGTGDKGTAAHRSICKHEHPPSNRCQQKTPGPIWAPAN